MKRFLIVALLLLPTSVFAQSKEELLQLENYQLRLLLLEKEHGEIKSRFDALKTKIDAEQAKAKAEKKDEPTEAK